MRSRRDLDRWLLFTVFFTNLCSLAFQVLWVRKFSFLFGSTAAVFSSVLAIFLLGLAVGARVGGVAVDRARQPYRLLAWTQVVLGAYCAASLPIFDAGRAAYLALAPASLSPLGAATIKLAVVAACILLPTAAIGAVFPIATRLYARNQAALGGDISTVYALDTLGAGLGALLAALLFVTRLGLLASTVILGAAIGILGAVIFLAAGAGPLAASPVAEPKPKADAKAKAKAKKGAEPSAPLPPAPALSPRQMTAVLWTFCATGAAAVLLETGWNRLFNVLNGTSVYSLAVVLAGFLGGLGVGSLLVRRWIDSVRRPLLLTAYLFAAIALGGVLALRSSPLFERLYLVIFETTDTYATFQVQVCLLIFTIVFLPATAMGANFPLVAKACAPVAEQRGAAMGRVFFVNTLGAVLGALAGEFLVLPRWGFTGLAAFTLVLYAAAAVVFLRLDGALGRSRHALACGSILAVAALLSPLVLPFHMPLNAAYYHGLRAGSLRAFRSQTARLRPVWEKQGFYGHVAVVEYEGFLLLKHNGKTDASNSPGDNYAQLMMSQLPLLFHPAPREVLNIGLGGGVTLRGIVHHAGVERITQVEIDPLVAEAARLFFADFNDRALEDRRVELVINDGRNYVEGSPRLFDVIVSEPPNIWVAGVSGLFTRQFYQAAKAHLRPGGILSQWLPLHEMERDDFRVGLRTVTSVFAHAAVWTNGVDAIVLASDRPLEADPARVASRAAAPAIAGDLALAGMRPEEVPALMAKANFPDAGMPALLQGLETLNTDDLPLLEFNSARNLFVFSKQQRAR